MRPWHMTLEELGIGITVRMVTHLRLESVVCRWKPLNAHNVVLRLVVIIIRLLVVSDLRRTWSFNSVDLEFDLDLEGFLGGRSRRDSSWSARLCHIMVLWFVGDRIKSVRSFLISTRALEV